MRTGMIHLQRKPCMNQHLLWVLLALVCWGCGEEFEQSPPFPAGPATVKLDAEDFVTISPESKMLEGRPVFPFAYQVFGERFEGYLAHSQERVYNLGLNETFEDKIPFLDYSLEPGDTLHTFTPRKYHILIDRRQTNEGDQIYFILRRTRRGISDLEERQVWVISDTRGVLSVAEYQIDLYSGAVVLTMVGDSEWFRDPNITRQIKSYDYIRTIYMDKDRSLLYEFNKITGLMKCRDIKAREEIHRYQFENESLKQLIDYHIEPSESGITLVTSDNCYHFTESLNLIETGPCAR